MGYIANVTRTHHNSIGDKMQNQKTIRKFVRQEILKEAGKGMMRKRKNRVWKANETETNAGRYDGTNPDHRQKLAQDLYRNMTQAQEGFSSPRISQLTDGQEIIWKKRFENGMLLEVFTSVKFEPDVVMHNGQKYGKPQKSGRTFRFAPRAKGRVYYRLSYTIPGGYARVAGVPQGAQMTYSFTSTPVNRTGTFAQIIARINAGIGGLEQFAARIWKPAAFFSRVAKGFETVESIEQQMTQALPGRQSMAQEV
jgi:hypothetical protein